MFCSKCGKQIEPTYKICPYCGVPVAGASQEGSGVYQQPVQQTFQQPAQQPYPTPAPRVSGGTDGGMILALIGAIISIIALFLPVISASVFGFSVSSGSYINLDQGLLQLGGASDPEISSHILGIISMVLLVPALIFILTRVKVGTIIFAFLNMAWTGFVSIGILVSMNRSAGDFGSSLVQFGMGYYGLIVGSLLLLIGSFIMRSRHSR